MDKIAIGKNLSTNGWDQNREAPRDVQFSARAEISPHQSAPGIFTHDTLLLVYDASCTCVCTQK